MSVYKDIGLQLDKFIWDLLGEERVHELGGEFLQTPYESSNPHFDTIDAVVHNEGMFNAWLRHDYRHKGKIMLEHFQDSNPKLTREQASQLDQMIRTSFMSAFLVGEVRPGNIELEDLRSGTHYHVREYSMASQVHTGQFLILRLSQQDDHWEIIMPDGSIAPFTLESENLIEKFVGELPETVTMQHTTGYILLCQELGIDEEYDLREPRAAKQLSKKEAAAALKTVMAETAVDRYVSPETIMKLMDAEFASSEKPLSPASGVRILLGLCGGDLQAIGRLMDAGTDYWNSHVSKRALKKPHTPDIVLSEFNIFGWQEKADEAHASMVDQDLVTASRIYDELFEMLLQDQTTTSSLYRIVANAASAQLAQGNMLYGRKLLEIALEMCPSYDFALKQEALLEEGYYDGARLRKEFEDDGQDLENLLQKMKDMQERMGPPSEKIRAFSDKVLLQECKKHGVDIDPKTFAELAAGYKDQYDLARALTGDDVQHVDAVYGLLDEVRNRWAPDVIWVDTLHGLADDYDQSLYDKDGQLRKNVAKAKKPLEQFAHALEAATDDTVQKWMHDSSEYAGYRQNIVFAALTIRDASLKQPELYQAALALCELAERRTGDPVFMVPHVLETAGTLDIATYKRQLKTLAARLPNDHVSFQTIGDQLAGRGDHERAIEAYELGLAALDHRYKKKLWQNAPYDYDTLAESYQYLSEQLGESYVAVGRDSDDEKLLHKLEKIEADERTEHNESTDRLTQGYQSLVAAEAGESAILRYLEWFDTLDIDLSSGDGQKTVLTKPKDVKIGRNDPCPCGALRASGLPKKYKNCCGT